MYQTGKAYQTTEAMQNYNPPLLGTSETRWIQSGQNRLISDEMILYSGHEEDDASHMEVVVLILSKSAEKALLSWKAHGAWLITATF